MRLLLILILLMTPCCPVLAQSRSDVYSLKYPDTVWGNFSRELSSTATSAKCMSGTSPNVANMKLDSVSLRLTDTTGDDEVRVAVYSGGNLATGPDGATLLEDLGKIHDNGDTGWEPATSVTNPSIPANTPLWICAKSDEGTSWDYTDESTVWMDFQTAKGRWLSDCESTDADDGWDSPFCTNGGGSTFANYWYSAYITYYTEAGTTQTWFFTSGG